MNYFLSTFNGVEDKLYYTKVTNPGEEWYVNNRRINNDPRLTKTTNNIDFFNENGIFVDGLNGFGKFCFKELTKGT